MSGQPSSQLPENPFGIQDNHTYSPAGTNGKTVLLVVGGLVIFVALAIVAIVLVGLSVRRSVYKHGDSDAKARHVDRDSVSEVAHGMALDSERLRSAKAQKLETQIAEIMNMLEESDGNETLDAEGFINQMNRAVPDPDFTFIDAMMIKNSVTQYCNVPEHWDNYQIQSVDWLSDDWVVVYFVAWDEYSVSEATEFRWWMVQRDGVWKIADHEPLYSGFSEAEEYGYLYKHSLDSNIDNYYTFWDVVYEAYEADDLEPALEKLASVASKPYPRPLRDLIQLETGNAFRAMGHGDRALPYYESVGNKSRHPGVYLGMAECAADESKHEMVIHHTDEYLKHLGVSLTAAYLRVSAFRELGQDDRAVDELIGIVKIQTDEVLPYEQLLTVLSAQDASRFVAIVRDSDDPPKLALKIADRIFGLERIGWLDLLIEAIRTDAEPSATSLYLQGLKLSRSYDYEAAAPILATAIGSAKGEVAKACQRELITVMSAIGKPLEALAHSVDKDLAFEMLFRSVGVTKNEDTFNRLLDLYEKHETDKTAILVVRAKQLEQLNNYTEAATMYQSAIAASSDEESIAKADFALTRLASLTGKELERYAAKKGDETTFLQLARSLARDRRWAKLDKLLAEHHKEAEDSFAVSALEIRLLVATKRTDEAQDLLAEYRSEASEEEQRQVDRKTVRLALRTGNWRDLLESSDNPEATFKTIARILRTKQDAGRLAEAIALAEAAEINGDKLLEAKLDLAWMEGNDSQLLNIFETNIAAEFWDHGNYWAIAWKTRIMAAMINTNRLKQAEKLVDMVDATQTPITPLLLAIHNRNPEETQRHLRVLERDDDLSLLHRWPELAAPLWDSPELAEVANEYPQDCLYDVNGRQFHLFYAADRLPDLQALLNRTVSKLPKDTAWKQLSTNNFIQPVISAFRLDEQGNSIAAVLVDRETIATTDEELPESMTNFKYCLTVSVIEPFSRERPLPRSLLDVIVPLLINESCIAVLDGTEGRMIEDPANQIHSHLAGDNVGEQSTMAISPIESEVEHWRRMGQIAPKFLAFQKNPSIDARVQVSFSLASTTETTWLRVIGIKNEEYSNTLVCEYESETALCQIPQPGIRVKVPLYRVLKWE